VNTCPKCNNEEVLKYYVTGIDAETGKKYCDVCVKQRRSKMSSYESEDIMLGNKE